MSRKSLWFYIPALVALLAVIRLGTLPAATNAKALVIAIGAAMILLAWRFHYRGAPVQRWVLLLIAAPALSFAMVFATLGWGA